MKVELVHVTVRPDIGGERVIYSKNVYWTADSPAARGEWDRVLESVAVNLAATQPREELVFWTHELENGEVSLGMTPSTSRRRLDRLLIGGPRPSSPSTGTLGVRAEPVLKWRTDGVLVRLWNGEPPEGAADHLGGVAVENRSYRIVRLPLGGKGDEPAGEWSDARYPLRIERMTLQNAKRFELFEARFAPSFTVLIGENGAGKTSILGLLARALAAWTPEEKAPRRARGLVRETLESVERTVYVVQHFPFRIEVTGTAPNGRTFQYLEDGEGATVRHFGERWLHRAANDDVHVPLPVVAYFSPLRDPPRAKKPTLKLPKPRRRIDGYGGALDLHADLIGFAAWFKAHEMDAVVEGVRSPLVEAVRATVIRAIPGCSALRWVPKLDDVVVTIEGVTQPVWGLSDGFRTMLALVGEIAWRAAILNPALGENVAQQVNGVVLIDELDLHLHPRWQRRVVDDLRRAFPHVQFIATTHSPFVVQSMRADEVINLDRRPSLDYQSASVEDIAEVEMGLDNVTRSLAFREKVEAAKQYLEALEHRPNDEQGLRALKDRLDKTQERFGADPAFVALLMRKRAARGLE